MVKYYLFLSNMDSGIFSHVSMSSAISELDRSFLKSSALSRLKAYPDGQDPLAFEELGPTFIKLAIAETVPGHTPADLITSLERLQ